MVCCPNQKITWLIETFIKLGELNGDIAMGKNR